MTRQVPGSLPTGAQLSGHPPIDSRLADRFETDAGDGRRTTDLIRMSETRITSAQALVADSTAILRLLDEVPDAGEICAELSKPYFTRRWRQSDGAAFWIASDGTRAVCHTLTGLELDEVIALWLSFDDYRRRPGFTLSARSLGRIIETELGVTVELDE